jgi:lysozyme
MALEGIDVSSYQGEVVWSKVAQSGKVFAFCKATEDLDYRDTQFTHNWAGCHAHGLVRGAYHYLHPTESGVEQADYLHEYVHQFGGSQLGDFVILDVEDAMGLAHQFVIECCEQFVERVRTQMHRNCILYTYPDFWLHTLGDPISTVLASCPLWLADYGPNVPSLANWPRGLSFWQYSETGHCPGVVGNVDLSRFYGTRQQLRRLAKPPGVR